MRHGHKDDDDDDDDNGLLLPEVVVIHHIDGMIMDDSFATLPLVQRLRRHHQHLLLPHLHQA